MLLGDFNQTVPCTHAPDEVFNKLKEVLKGLTVATSGEKQANMRQMIDHVCHSPDLACDGDESSIRETKNSANSRIIMAGAV